MILINQVKIIKFVGIIYVTQCFLRSHNNRVYCNKNNNMNWLFGVFMINDIHRIKIFQNHIVYYFLF